MYHVIKVKVGQEHPMFPYMEHVTKCGNNVYNAGLFRVRQIFTALNKDENKRTENERFVLQEIEDTLPRMQTPNKHFEMPTKKKCVLKYDFLNALMKNSHNPDYYAEGFNVHSAQQMLKQVVQDMKSFDSLRKKWLKKPSSLNGKPNIPRYKKKQGQCTTTFTNESCKIKNGTTLTFPKTDLSLAIGQFVPEHWILKEVKVKPHHNVYTVILCFDDGKAEDDKITDKPTRVCAIDLGVNNFAAITNNVGLPGLLFKGNVIKSRNQWYNKQYAKIQSEQTKGGTEQFIPTEESKKIGLKRENQMNDFMHKVAKRILEWCLLNKIDTVIVGANKGWKQNSKLGKVENQNFVPIPHAKFREIMKYLCARNGLHYLEQEESYTSMASFKHMDFIPVYGSKHEDDVEKYVFSGYRGPTLYKGMKRKNGFHGLYKNNDGTIVNADINGSANIGRKCLPELFNTDTVNLNDVHIIRFPDDVSKYPLWGRATVI